MKSLSIKQPFATWIMTGIKTREHRTYNTKFRGNFIVHSSKKPDVEFMKAYGISPDNFPNGVLLGIANLTGTIKHTDNDFAWLVESLKAFDMPIEHKGQLGFFEVEDVIWKKELT